MTRRHPTALVGALGVAVTMIPAGLTACNERFDFGGPRAAEQSTSFGATGDGSGGMTTSTEGGTRTTAGEPDAGFPTSCTTDVDCRIASLHCHPESLKCVECVDDSDCTDGGGYCDDGLFRCVDCTEDAHCAEGARCDGAERRCAPACETTQDCVGAHACRNNLCVSCDRDIECRELDPSNPVCSVSGLDCVSCREDAQCPQPQLCDVLSGRCVACLSSVDCGGGGFCDPKLLECVEG